MHSYNTVHVDICDKACQTVNIHACAANTLTKLLQVRKHYGPSINVLGLPFSSPTHALYVIYGVVSIVLGKSLTIEHCPLKEEFKYGDTRSGRALVWVPACVLDH